MKDILDISKNASPTTSFVLSKKKHSNQPGAMA